MITNEDNRTAASHAPLEAVRQILGKEGVQTDRISRLLYSTDASNYQIIPIGVCFPSTSDDVIAIQQATSYGQKILDAATGLDCTIIIVNDPAQNKSAMHFAFRD